MEEDEWLKILEPKTWRYRDVDLCVSKWAGERKITKKRGEIE